VTINTDTVGFNKWQSFSNSTSTTISAVSTAVNFHINAKAVLYSRFKGFGLLCFLRDIFTTHSTNTCQHGARYSTTITTAAAHTSTPCTVQRTTEVRNSCEHRCAPSAAARDLSNTSLIFATSFTLLPIPYGRNSLQIRDCCIVAINPLKSSGKYVYQLLIISSTSFCTYGFRTISRINSDNFLNQH
jgi:hypothetical protein